MRWLVYLHVVHVDPQNAQEVEYGLQTLRRLLPADGRIPGEPKTQHPCSCNWVWRCPPPWDTMGRK